MMKSEFLKLKKNDLVKGLIVSIMTAVLISLQQMIEVGGLNNVDYTTITQMAITTGIGYLIKNVLTNHNDQFLKK